MSSFITAVGDQGRLFLGYGDQDAIPESLGKSINVYTNFFTKFVTKLFGFSVEVDIGGKNRVLNKKSFAKHLASIGLSDLTVKDVQINGYEASIKNNFKTTSNSGKLSDNLSDKKRMKLFKKMASLLAENSIKNTINTPAVIKLIRKGAYVDKEFFMSLPTASWEFSGDQRLNYYWITLKECVEENRFGTAVASGKVHSYTPLVRAIECGDEAVTTLILKAKNYDITSDVKKLHIFERTLATLTFKSAVMRRVVQKEDGTVAFTTY